VPMTSTVILCLLSVRMRTDVALLTNYFPFGKVVAIFVRDFIAVERSFC